MEIYCDTRERKRRNAESLPPGIEREENESALLPQSKQHISAAKYTVDIMEGAPTIIFVVNSLGKGILSEMTPEEHIYEM